MGKQDDTRGRCAANGLYEPGSSFVEITGTARLLACSLLLTGACFSILAFTDTLNDVHLRTSPSGTVLVTAVFRDLSVTSTLVIMAGADLLFLSLCLVVLHNPNDRVLLERSTRAVLGWLWFFVVTVLLSIATLHVPPEQVFRRDRVAKLLALLPLVVGKELLYRRLHSAFERTGCLFTEALAWNCRKDGLFNAFFLVALASSVTGLPPVRVHYLLYFAKLYLLGGATLSLQRRLDLVGALYRPAGADLQRDHASRTRKETAGPAVTGTLTSTSPAPNRHVAADEEVRRHSVTARDLPRDSLDTSQDGTIDGKEGEEFLNGSSSSG